MSESKKGAPQPSAGSDVPRTAETQPLLPDEFYFDGPYLVFTETYHRRRGFCCNSDCRHCPYK